MITLALFSHSPYLCGAERMLLNLALMLARSGDVRPVLLVPGEGELAGEARRQGVTCRIVPAPPWYIVPPGDMFAYCRGVRDCRTALRTVLVDLNADAVLVNTMTNVPAMLAAVELEIPSLVWVHGVIDSLLLPQRSSEFAAPHDELLLHSATRVIALSNYTSEFCARVMRRRRLDVVHNWTPFDPHFAAPAEKYRSRRFVCLNTFDPHKGHATLLEAAELLKDKKVFFELDLYGDGQVRNEIERRTAALGLQEHVRFRGRTTNVEAAYDGALGVVNPAQVEPFGMTLIEAMARKTPAVATRCGGPQDIVVDGQTGFLVARGNASALADRMEALLKSPDLARRLGDAGFQRVASHFHEGAARTAFLPIIEDAIRDFRGYEPAVKSLANVYHLWLEQIAGLSVSPAYVQRSAGGSRYVRLAARVARGGMRRTRALGKRVLAAIGVGGPDANAVNGAAHLANALSGPNGAATSIGPAGRPQKFRSVRRKVRYRLVPDQSNWAGLDVLVSRNPLLAAGRLRLKVRSASGQTIRETASPLAGLGEKGWLGFRFSPVANATGMSFDVELIAEGAFPTGGIGICECDALQISSQTAARLRFPWQRKALYCKTWYTE